jgi:hypothetical protein
MANLGTRAVQAEKGLLMESEEGRQAVGEMANLGTRAVQAEKGLLMESEEGRQAVGVKACLGRSCKLATSVVMGMVSLL